ncbi:alpha/beta hydrolase-fold protein [Rhodococcus sp. NPDC059234]|uniref:alpha/beta hydrolase-fold protein n=1 Tax=Rhodococcus sp. NPDC059234 TaxID=3346781 RepID=UPI0036735992
MHAAGTRPTLYLLDGAEAHDEESGWTAMTDLDRLARGADVNVVVPVGGAHSYYTDWRAVDPVMGKLSYETFLTRELPPLIDGRLGGNGVNAVADPPLETVQGMFGEFGTLVCTSMMGSA